MTLQDIVERLRSQCPSLVSVALVYDMADIATPDFDTPATFVTRLSDEFDPNTGLGALVSQRRNRRFGVITVASAPTDIAEPLEDARNQVLAALVGWQPDESTQVAVVSGEALATESGLVHWLDTFTYQDYARYVR